ncbi:hypothetical protein GOP47_0014408 [Adiantum capillus-veneris]|uniref:DNA topoisomerase 2 n=1 Tax=Adiantum capillus-veneris TaxID=13818 RepID=A0A9D4ULF1_ADICA|nr:hypothetical protein GOP47_0014408 [Adiantum capillus-veneris]
MENILIEQENFGLSARRKSTNSFSTTELPIKPPQYSPGTKIGSSGGRKTLEETYQKKTQLEHILLRPDTYVGSIEKHTENLWVYEEQTLVCRSITFVPGLYKIFDEILVNAADNKQRDPSMNTIRVTIDAQTNTISVFNNGAGVPVEIHGDERIYVPELIFGHLLTSSNYDDTLKKSTGGRNGYGAKLANIFSSEFIVETADGRRMRRYKQLFKSNMNSKSKPVITACKATESWTKVTFKPDLAIFHMATLEDDIVALMSKRVVDLAGCLGKSVKVELNGLQLRIKSFQEYVGLYLDTVNKKREDPLPWVYERANDRWEVCVSLSDGQFQQVSFVNAIATTKGGSHVQYVTDQIVKFVMNLVNKKIKNAGVKAFQIRNHLWVFVNSLIDNPAFESQAKEILTSRQSSFGSKCVFSRDFMKKVAKCGIVENILSWADIKQSKDLRKNDGAKRQRLTGIAKLDDANDASGRYSKDCTLILTEGDSAKALAMSGISVIGRNRYGVFPLRGKLLNVREASHKQIMENQEINHIKQILGLQHGKQYDDVKSLRYGHLMIMTDQDHDGSHIKGLLINFIHCFWPSLLKIPSFLLEFITPIVKATHKNGKVFSFYTIPEYEAWRESLNGHATCWSIKYYKGLGTSTSKEGKEYFRDLDKNKKEFIWEGVEDREAIEMAFSKKKVEARKHWLHDFEPGTYLDHSRKAIKYRDFVNRELILFSMADLARSIPSIVDGLKPGQRKVLFCSFKRNFVTQAKVAQLSGYVSEHSAYHHGEQSLVTTIIGMAQNYVGSNNINLLSPLGQFGTRSQGGKDHASGRYIFTCLNPITRFLFPKEDDILLHYYKEDGQSIEPVWYCPILPMVLVNGCDGIGTGWSTFVPNYNPRDIVANIQRLLDGLQTEPMHPWYKGFKGTIEHTSTKESGISYTIKGVYKRVDKTTIQITELPIRKWTQDYKEFLEGMMNPRDKGKEPFIKDYKEHSTDTQVNFEVHLSQENMAQAIAEGVSKRFKLSTTISTSNMHLFDAKGRIQKFNSPEQILEAFFNVRLELYVRRKEVQLRNLQLELLKVENKVRFVISVVKGEIIVSSRKMTELHHELKVKGFTPFPKNSKSIEPVVAGGGGTLEDEESNDLGEALQGVGAGDYEYLLSLPIGSMTMEKIQALCSGRDKLEASVEELRRATPKSLWIRDLEALENQLDVQELEEAQEEYDGRQLSKKRPGRAPLSTPTKQKDTGRGGLAQVPAPTTTAAACVQDLVDSEDEDYDYNESSDSDFKEAAKRKPKAPSLSAAAQNKYVGEMVSMDRVHRKRKLADPAVSRDGVYRKRIYGCAAGSVEGKEKAGIGRGQRLVTKILGPRPLCRQEEKVGTEARASSPVHKLPTQEELARSSTPVHKPPTQKHPAQKMRKMQVSYLPRQSGAVLQLEDEERGASAALALRLKRVI